jgi:hypothetical protein
VGVRGEGFSVEATAFVALSVEGGASREVWERRTLKRHGAITTWKFCKDRIWKRRRTADSGAVVFRLWGSF